MELDFSNLIIQKSGTDQHGALCRNKDLLMEKRNCAKIGADSSAKNTPNAPKFIRTICLLKPKSFGFQ